MLSFAVTSHANFLVVFHGSPTHRALRRKKMLKLTFNQFHSRMFTPYLVLDCYLDQSIRYMRRVSNNTWVDNERPNYSSLKSTHSCRCLNSKLLRSLSSAAASWYWFYARWKWMYWSPQIVDVANLLPRPQFASCDTSMLSSFLHDGTRIS
jgi:hypothetical protein